MTLFALFKFIMQINGQKKVHYADLFLFKEKRLKVTNQLFAPITNIIYHDAVRNVSTNLNF